MPIKANENCHDIRSDYAQSVINALPNQEAVELYLPQEALNSLSADVKNFQHGGTAGMLNYSLFSTKSQYSGNNSSSNRYSQASLEAGFNTMDWTLRSRYILTDDNGIRNAESIYTYAEHVFVPQRLTMQVGQIIAMSDVLSGVPITGVQFMPTSGLQKDSSGVSVSASPVPHRRALKFVSTVDSFLTPWFRRGRLRLMTFPWCVITSIWT